MKLNINFLVFFFFIVPQFWVLAAENEAKNGRNTDDEGNILSSDFKYFVDVYEQINKKEKEKRENKKQRKNSKESGDCDD